MAACGIVGRRGRPIKYPQIYEILKNEKYAGVYLFSPTAEKVRQRTKPNAIRIEGAIPAIVERTLFDEVQKVMKTRKQMGRKGNRLCSGLVYCLCGAKMHVHTRT